MTAVGRLSSGLVLSALLFGQAVTAARELDMASGQLLRLDTAARTLVIRSDRGTQLQYTVTGETRVVGAGDSLGALPVLTRLTVHYAKDETGLVAMEVEVHELPF